MRVGLIARTEDRGLGNLCWEWAQHMRPDSTLVVIPNHPLRQRLERYPGALVLDWDHKTTGELDEPAVRGWLEELGPGAVVYSAETFYDWRICDWARDQGVRTVCHVMPEFFRHASRGAPPAPDAWWAPTRWRLPQLPPATKVVPVPIALERFPALPLAVELGPPRWLHVAGMKAAADRNGTRLLLQALPLLRREHELLIRSQGQHIPRGRLGRAVRVSIDTRSCPEYWQLYEGSQALLMPRRYAGLSLPVLEAMGAGLAPVMTDAEPQRSDWPIIPVPSMNRRRYVTAPAGEIPLIECQPRALAQIMDRLAGDPAELAAARARAVEYARANSWEQLEPRIRSELEAVRG